MNRFLLIGFVLFFQSQLSYCADIVEEKIDGSKTVWKDDGTQIDITKNGQKTIIHP